MATIHHATRKRAEAHGITLDSPDGELFVAFHNGTMLVSKPTAKEALDEAIKLVKIREQAEIGPEGGFEPEDEEDEQQNADQDEQADPDAEDDDEDEGPRGSVVKNHYKVEYKARGDATCCGDDLSQILKTALTTTDDKGKPMVDLAACRDLAKENGLLERFEKWNHLNPGMQRMNLGNVFRRILREGGEVKIGKVTYEAEDVGIELES